jgi:hypothetical protein
MIYHLCGYYAKPLNMRRCKHTQWLNFVAEGEEIALRISNRLLNITDSLTDPYVQKPSIILLIGNKQKHTTLREIFHVKKTQAKRSANEIHLHVDPYSVFDSKPVLLAESDFISSTIREEVDKDKCHNVRRVTFQRTSTKPDPHSDAASVYLQLLSPFIDVICIFSDDIGGSERVAYHLATWLEHGHTATLPPSPCPRVVIVTERLPLGGEAKAKKDILCSISEQTTKDVSGFVSDIDVVAVRPRGSISSIARYRLLREQLIYGSAVVRSKREDAQMLFSMAHFAALATDACDHFAAKDTEIFNLIQASRVYNTTNPDIKDHLSNFLKHIKSPSELASFAAPIVGSSFLLDSYPPGSHRKL